LGAAALAEGTVLYKLFPETHPVATNAVGTSVGALLLLLLSVAIREARPLPASSTALLAFGYLILVGSVALFYLYLFVLRRWSATATSYAFLLFPVATVIIAAWVANEAVAGRFLVGGGVVLLGVATGSRR